MKILMLSDFHIGNENFDMHKSFHFIDRAYEVWRIFCCRWCCNELL